MIYYGLRVEFPDRTVSFLFPKPEVLAKVTLHELRLKASMGYRAESVVQVSRLIARGQLRLEELTECSYEEAVETLLDLPGVGPKVADCFLLYGVGKLEAAPVDVWIHRIVSMLYFRRRRVSRLKTARFLRERFEEWAGYAQLYLFDYARRTGFLPQLVMAVQDLLKDDVTSFGSALSQRLSLQLCAAHLTNLHITRISPKTSRTILNPIKLLTDPKSGQRLI